jgi:hypothetical protein
MTSRLAGILEVRRRDVLRFSLAVPFGMIAGAVPGQAQTMRPVNYVIVRSTDYVNRCVDCIPGKLYGASPQANLKGDGWRLLPHTLLADTIELSFEENAPGASSIPTGFYVAKVRQDATKDWMWTGGKVNKGQTIADRVWRIELQGVPHGRTNIQFHYGRDASWSNGCIIVGRQPENQCVNQCKHNDSPIEGVRAMRKHFESNAISIQNPINILVENGTL